MLNRRMLQREKEATIASVAVVVDEHKWSQNALKWAADHVISKGQMVALIRVVPTLSPLPTMVEGMDDESNGEEQNQTDFFLPYCVFCSTRDVLYEMITLHDNDIAKAIIEYIVLNRMETLVLGAPSKKKKSISRLFGKSHIPSSISKGVPDFCSVYVISKGKIASMRSAIRPLHHVVSAEKLPYGSDDTNGSKHYVSVLPRCRTVDSRGPDEYSVTSSNRSLMSSGRLSTDSMVLAFYDNLGSQEPSQRARRSSSVRRNDFEPFYSESKLNQFNQTDDDISSSEEESKKKSSSPTQDIGNMEEKLRRLELQMKQTMEMYHAACREALIEKQKAKELLRFRKDEENRLREEERAKEEALAIAEVERAKYKEAIELANAAQRVAKQEGKKRKIAERRAVSKEAEVKMLLESLNCGGQSHAAAAAVPRDQSLINILVVLSIFYLYSATQKCIFM